MYIQQLTLNDFRNIEHLDLEFHMRLNWVTGENGSGKTSLLEAIHCLSNGRSFRTPQSQHLIRHHQDRATVFCLLRQHGDKQVKIGIGIEKQRKEIHLDGEVIRSASGLASHIPVQLITPKVSQLIEEGPSYRRKFLDWGLFHVEHRYKSAWSKFNRILKQRNSVLKQKQSRSQLDLWDEHLVEYSMEIDHYRQAYIRDLQSALQPYLQELEEVIPIQLSLNSGWPKDRTLLDCLREHRDLDLQRGQTSYGPQRADIRIKTDQRLLKDVGSRGQIKLISSVLLFAQLSLLENSDVHKNAVLLIDDLGAEFDEENQQRILRWALRGKSQSIITSTEAHLPERLSSGNSQRMFHVEHGNFKEVV